MDSNDHQPPSSMVKSTMPKYRIRRMRMEDVEEVLKIWAENDLHEGIDTIQSFMRADPHGFVVAVQVDDQLLSPMHAADNNEREEEILSEPNRKSRFPSKQICCCVIQEQNSPPSKPSSSNSSSMSQLVERKYMLYSGVSSYIKIATTPYVNLAKKMIVNLNKIINFSLTRIKWRKGSEF